MTAYRADNAPKPIPCSGCGTFIDARSASYALDGTLVCAACSARGQIEAANVRGRESMSFDRVWVKIAIVVFLVGLRLFIKYGLR